MADANQAPTGNGLVKLSKCDQKNIDWDDLFRKIKNNGSIPTVTGTNIEISSDFAGQKDEGKMKSGNSRFDVQSVSETYATVSCRSGRNPSPPCC